MEVCLNLNASEDEALEEVEARGIVGEAEMLRARRRADASPGGEVRSRCSVGFGLSAGLMSGFDGGMKRTPPEEEEEEAALDLLGLEEAGGEAEVPLR